VKRVRLSLCVCGMALWVGCGTTGLAVQASGVRATTVSEGLDRPTAVVVQPQTGRVYVMESGAGRVVRVVDGQREDVIQGLPRTTAADRGARPVGPRGMAFVDLRTVVVSGSAESAGRAVLAVFTIQPAGGAAVQAGQATAQLQPPVPRDVAADELTMLGVARGSEALFVVCRQVEAQGWIARAELRGNSVGELRPLPGPRLGSGQTAITVSPQGDLVVGHRPENGDGDGWHLAFFNARTGRSLLSLPTSLREIVGLAYAADGNLYALGWARSASGGEGGLYRLDASPSEDGQQAIRSERLLALDRPTALAAAPEGDLYVTVLGPESAGGPTATGKLLRIELTR